MASARRGFGRASTSDRTHNISIISLKFVNGAMYLIRLEEDHPARVPIAFMVKNRSIDMQLLAYVENDFNGSQRDHG